MQQVYDRPNDIKSKGPNARPNQIHTVVDSLVVVEAIVAAVDAQYFEDMEEDYIG